MTSRSGLKKGKRAQETLSIFHVPNDILSILVLPPLLNRRIHQGEAASRVRASTQPNDSQKEDISQLSRRLAAAVRVTRPQCNVCGGIEFASAEEQRRHFKTGVHEANLVRKLVWRRDNPDAEALEGQYPWEPAQAGELGSGPSGIGGGNDDDDDGEEEDGSAWSESDVSVVGESAAAEADELVLGNHGRATMDAEALVEEIESGRRGSGRGGWLSRGGESSDSDDDGDNGVGRTSSPWLWFASEPSMAGDSPSVTVYGIHRRILVPRGQRGEHASSDEILRGLQAMQLPEAPKQSQLELKGKEPRISDSSSVWVILATNGGFFAGAVFDNRTGQVVAHKTFQRYTTRRKQGGSQARQDNAMGRAAKSAGAQIRRYNEQKLQEEIRQLMGQWQEYLRMSSCVFVRVAKTQRRGFFGPPGDGAAQIMQWSDPRVRSVPVPMARPSLAELQRVYRELATVRIKEVRRSDVCEPDSGKGEASAAGGRQQEQGPDDVAAAAAAAREEDSGSEHTLDAEPRPDLLAFLHHVAKMIINQEEPRTDRQIVDYLDQNIGQLLDALSDPAIGLRYLPDTDAIQAHRTPTLLHLASAMGRVELVPYLMDHGEDPTVTNGRPPLFAGGQTAYEVAKDDATRDAFYAYRLENAGDVDNPIEWQRSGVPDQQLRAEEQRDLEREARAREKKRRERERKKAKEKARKQQRAQEEAERADDAALEQAQRDNSKSSKQNQKGLASLSQSELRARMLSMAYASASSWGSAGGGQQLAQAQAATGQRPVSPSTQRARDRELRFQAAERRRQQQQQQQQSISGGPRAATTGECTHCGRLLHGLVPFEQFDWKCCSLQCLQDHRAQH